MAEQGYIWRLAGVKQEPQTLIKDFVLSPVAKKVLPYRLGEQMAKQLGTRYNLLTPYFVYTVFFKSVV